MYYYTDTTKEKKNKKRRVGRKKKYIYIYTVENRVEKCNYFNYYYLTCC